MPPEITQLFKINNENDMNNREYRYQLESRRVTGRLQKKYQCPQCKQMRCFVRYVDTHNGCCYVADDVGKCDHQNSCGYHYRPGDYYRDNQWAAEPHKPAAASRYTPPPQLPLQPLPMTLVWRSHSPVSTFWQWVTTVVAPHLGASTETVSRVFHDYLIGATHQSDVIFWQVDLQGRVHTGHIMCYRPDGHRQGYQSWTHYQLQRRGELPLNYQPPKCLYGEHLLTVYGDKPVGLVESEKTALLMAISQPELLWLATAGCGGLTAEKLAPLRSRRLLVFPDSGCYAKWSQQLSRIDGLDYAISASLEQYPANTDLADLLLR